MRRVVLVVGLLALVTGAVGGAAPAPGRAQMIRELEAAIAEEKQALELSRKRPPRYEGAALQLRRASSRLEEVADAASEVSLPQSVESGLRDVALTDRVAAIGFVQRLVISGDDGTDLARRKVEEALRKKLLLLEQIRTATAPSGTPQCSDATDNDDDGITDWKLESGCTSARDVRESSPFSCAVESRIASGRLVLSGSCSGPFSEVEFTVLDGVQLNGRYDVMHAPSCGAPKPTGVRCKTKEGDQNPGHLIDARFSTTSKDPSQRVQLRFFDIRKRQIGRFVVPPMR
jgi:microcompartment protein CcmK/EutM